MKQFLPAMRTRNALVSILILCPTLAAAQTVTWVDNANGQFIVDCNGPDPGGEFFWPDNNNWSQVQLLGLDPCDSNIGGFEREPSNWSTPTYPDGTTVDVVLTGRSPTDLDLMIDVGTLSVDGPNTLRIPGASTLDVHGGSIVNNGMIDLEDFSVSLAILRINANTNLTGSGTVRFNSDDDNIITSSNPAHVLTIGPDQNLLATSVAIAGDSASRIATAFTNNGTITADVGGLQIDTYPKTNNNLIRAINGGTIVLRNTSVDNPVGTIQAGASSTVILNNANVSGGLLGGPGTFRLTSAGETTLNGPLEIDSSATVQLGTTNDLKLTGTITNNGMIRINDVGTSLTELIIDGNVTLDGSGQVLFESNDDNLVVSADPENDVLTIGPDQEFTTTAAALAGFSQSRLVTATTNNGTITANEGGLQLDTGPKINNTLIRAINGGNLQFDSVTITNDEGGGDPAVGDISLDATSTLDLDGATILGGTLSGAGTVTLLAADAILDNLTIGPDLTVAIHTTDILTIRNTIANNGTILLNDVGVSSARLRIDDDVTLAGTGRVLFQGDDDNFVDSVKDLPEDPDPVLTIGPDQEFTTASDTIAGFSESRVIAALINNGTITADQGGLQLDTLPKVNNNLIRAINGGNLQFDSVTITNDEGGGDPAVGDISVDATSTLDLDGATILGGTLSGAGTVNLLASDAILDNLTIGPDLTVAIHTTDILTVRNTIANNGTIVLNDVGVSSARLRIDADVTLAGTGRVLFQGNDDNYIDSLKDLPEDPDPVLTIGPDQELITAPDTLAGDSASRVIGVVTNNGTITADQGGLQLDTLEKVNNGVIQATNGGTLRFSAVSIDNTNGTITAGAGSVVVLHGATINGGLIDGAGDVDLTTFDATLNGVTIAPGIRVTIGTNDVLTVIGTISNNGTIVITDTSAGFATVNIDGDVTLNGNGRVLLNSNDDNVLGSADPADVLTVGANQTITTIPAALAGQSFLTAATINNGVIEGREGGLSLATNPKTNNGTFRAIAGGELEVVSTATVLTNYTHATNTLSGGRYEVIATGTPTTMDFQGADIQNLAAGTEVILSGAGATFPALANLSATQGTLAIRDRHLLSTTGNSSLGGRLEFGLTDGATDGFDATRWDIDGDVDFTNLVIDVTDLGLTPGSYEVVTWTGTRTGLPVLGNIPGGADLTITAGGASLFLNVGDARFDPPVLLGVAYEAGSNTSTLTYQSIDGVSFRVLGGEDLESLSLLATETAVGDGSVMQYAHNPPGSPAAYYYQLTR